MAVEALAQCARSLMCAQHHAEARLQGRPLLCGLRAQPGAPRHNPSLQARCGQKHDADIEQQGERACSGHHCREPRILLPAYRAVGVPHAAPMGARFSRPGL